MHLLRLLRRAAWITATLSLFALFVLLRGAGARLIGRPREVRQACLGRTLLALFRLLGAAFIKIGQFLSTRPDLVPQPVQLPLRELQDRVGPFPYTLVRRTLAAELGEAPERVFADLDPYPIASASVAQVHRGTLADGRAVAVKVLRPRIEATMRIDLAFMRLVGHVLSVVPLLRRYRPREIIEEFAAALGQQLDLRVEAENNRRFAANFADDPRVRLPVLVPHLCTSRVLTMELVHGVKILGPQWGRARAEDLARAGIQLLLKMIFVDGFVHADLHPGNLLVDGVGRLVLLDVGLVARLSAPHREALAQLLGAWAAGDSRRLAQLLLGFAASRPADGEGFTADVDSVVQRHRGVPLAQLQVGLLLLDLARLLRRRRLRVEPALTMVIVAIGVVEGVGRQLAPQLDVVGELFAFFAAWGRRLGVGAGALAN